MKLKGGGRVGVWVPLGWPWPCQTAQQRGDNPSSQTSPRPHLCQVRTNDIDYCTICVPSILLWNTVEVSEVIVCKWDV